MEKKNITFNLAIIQAKKLSSIIESCKTVEQLKCMKSFCIKFSKDVKPLENALRKYCDVNISDIILNMYSNRLKSIISEGLIKNINR